MTTLLMPHVAARIFDTPLMIDARKAHAILLGLGGRIIEGGVVVSGEELVDHVAFAAGRPSMGRLGDPLGSRIAADGAADRVLFKIGSTAVIPVEGTLVHKGKYLGASSGNTSYEGLQTRIAAARSDPGVKGVAFEIDSFGGEVAGAFDTAAMIARLSSEKPTLAILTDNALSAAYLLASAARQVVIPETGFAGSIGVVTLHADLSKKLENEGVKVTVISSGAHKAAGHPALPLAPEAQARVQAHVDAARDLFADAVGRFRGTRLDKRAALATEALDYRGADAVAAGLADGVMYPNAAFEAFVSAINRA